LNRPFRRTWKRCGFGKQLILVSGLSDGQDVAHFRMVVDALMESDYHVILSIGRQIEPNSLGEIPSNFEINIGAHHLEMLPYTALMICQGGVGTILEAIYHGVPLICIPPDTEDADNSYRVAELGLGKYLRKEELTADLIRDCVTEVLSDGELLDRVKRMQEVFKKSGGARAAVDSIDEFLGSCL